MADEGNQISNAVELVKSYAKQETIDPLKHLSTFFKWGAIGGALVLFGSLFIVLGTLRSLQAIDTNDDATNSVNVKDLSVGELNQLVASAVADEMAAGADPEVLSLAEVNIDELTIGEFNDLVASAESAAPEAPGEAPLVKRFLGYDLIEYFITLLVAVALAALIALVIFRRKS